MRRQGVTRRSFLKYCSLAATSLGLGAGMAPKIAWALEKQTAHSGGMDPRSGMHLLYRIFLSAPLTPLAKDVILSLISLDYDDTLMAAAGTQAERSL
ncbi:hydrogenase 1, small subunit [Escherichia coli]|uniref:Hydrogenase 1, small subunit n=1 Tax=Escherichia coli TaxID=562 RepID=A0A2X1J003_ECOLX|nr:hydrogenase 1, small subunit [Escherichia coli]